jgi:hypothetical protein
MNQDPRSLRHRPLDSGSHINAGAQRPGASTASARSAAALGSASGRGNTEPRQHQGFQAVAADPVAESNAHSLSFDDVIRSHQERRWDRDAERPRRLETDDEVELRRLLDGEIAGVGPLY